MIPSILIIEDNDDDSELMLAAVQSACQTLRRVRTLEDGLSQLDRDPPDVVLLDVGLPGVTEPNQAINAVKAVKAKKTAVIVVSGNSDPNAIRNGILANASGWIVKGNWGALLHEVRAAYDSHRHNNAIIQLTAEARRV